MTDSSPVVILTGASSGIGAALAVELARHSKARIALLARRIEPLEEVAKQVVDAGGEALAISCDVVDVDAVNQAVADTVARWGAIDMAIANAGIGDPMPMKRIEAHGINRVMRINFEGSTNLFAAVVPAMLERGSGHLVGVSSIAAFRGLPRSGPYSASKAALSTMMESMRLELKPRGIAVTAVHPGFVATPMTNSNPFKMPFLVPVDKAARLMVRRLARRPREINFPWPMVLAVRIARALPNWLYDFALGERGSRKSKN